MYKIYTTKDLIETNLNNKQVIKKTDKLLGFILFYKRFTHLSGFMEV